MSIGSRTGCLLAGHYLSKRVVYRLSRTKVRVQVSVDHDDLARTSRGVMTTAGTTPKSLVIDLRHLLQSSALGSFCFFIASSFMKGCVACADDANAVVAFGGDDVKDTPSGAAANVIKLAGLASLSSQEPPARMKRVLGKIAHSLASSHTEDV